MQQIDKEKIPDDEKDKAVELERELKGIASLRSTTWQKVEADQTHVVFSKKLPKYNLEIIKTYSLVKVPEDSMSDPDFKAYNLEFSIKIVNRGETVQKSGVSPGRCKRFAEGRLLVCQQSEPQLGRSRDCATWWCRSNKTCRQ